MTTTLYDYYRSTAAYRVRIALHYKGVAHQHQQVHLVKDGGEQHSSDYHAINPQELVPSLVIDDHVLTQSLAIIEYLDEIYPQAPLLPQTAIERAHVRSLAYIIACDIHPVNNLRVLQYLKHELNVSDEQKLAWYHHWLKLGFAAIEERLSTSSETGLCCRGDVVTLADVCLIPQVYNAHRFELPMEDYPTINQINEYCLSLDYFQKATPEANAGI